MTMVNDEKTEHIELDLGLREEQDESLSINSSSAASPELAELAETSEELASLDRDAATHGVYGLRWIRLSTS